jgi:hypothetical protein
MDREAAARAIADEAKRVRGRPSRGLWLAALLVSAVCVGGLAIGWLGHRDEPGSAHAPRAQAPATGGGFSLGLVVGLGAGVVIGSLMAARRRGQGS